MSERWFEPVRITMGGVTHIVFDNVRATEILMVEWPGKRERLHQAAEQALLRSMKAGDDPDKREDARIAFATAARDVGILAGGIAAKIVHFGYQLTSDDGAETFTTNRALADRLTQQGWMQVGYVALPIPVTEAMAKAAETELAAILGGLPAGLPENAMHRVVRAALGLLNGG